MLDIIISTAAIGVLHATGQGGKNAVISYGPVAVAYLIWASIIAYNAVVMRTTTLSFIHDNSIAQLVVGIALLTGIMLSGRGVLSHVFFAAFVILLAVIVDKVISYAAPESVESAVWGTIGTFVVMAAIGLAAPETMAKLQPLLVIALTALVVVSAVLMLLGYSGGRWLAAVSMIVFAGLIASDVAKLSIERAGVAASAISFPEDIVSLVLDAANVFTTLLSQN